MALDRWYGVTCDACHLAGEVLPTARHARAAARKAGWKRIPGERYRGHLAGQDLCPKCATKDRDDH